MAAVTSIIERNVGRTPETTRSTDGVVNAEMSEKTYVLDVGDAVARVVVGQLFRDVV